jgi:hypothetical protein
MAFEKNMAGGDGGMFPQHPKSGDWETLKGRMLAPYELDGIESDSAHNGSARAGAPNRVDYNPIETFEVQTPTTGGGGTFAK